MASPLTAATGAVLGSVPERHRATAAQFMKFLVTGTIGTLVDFGTYNVLTRGFLWQSFYVVLGQKILVANNVSVLLAIISNFLMNRYWTFRGHSGTFMNQWAGYFVLNAITWALNQFLTSYLTFNVPLMAALFGLQRDNAAKALAIGCILLINFFGSKFIVFRPKAA